MNPPYSVPAAAPPETPSRLHWAVLLFLPITVVCTAIGEVGELIAGLLLWAGFGYAAWVAARWALYRYRAQRGQSYRAQPGYAPPPNYAHPNYQAPPPPQPQAAPAPYQWPPRQG